MTPVTTDRVARSFNRSFHSYHSSASQQAHIAQQLAQRLADLGAPQKFRNGFEFGCGTGHLTAALHHHFSFTNLTLNDLMPASRQTADSHDATFLFGDVQEITWPKQPDLIASASTIQWMKNPGVLLHNAAQELASGGWLALSGFGPQQYRELSNLGSTAAAPGLCRPEELVQALETAGSVTILESSEDCHQLWFDTPTEVLKHLRQTGVNAGAAKNWTRRTLRQFCEAYQERFGEQRGVPLTYHPIWIIARKQD